MNFTKHWASHTNKLVHSAHIPTRGSDHKSCQKLWESIYVYPRSSRNLGHNYFAHHCMIWVDPRGTFAMQWGWGQLLCRRERMQQGRLYWVCSHPNPHIGRTLLLRMYLLFLCMQMARGKINRRPTVIGVTAEGRNTGWKKGLCILAMVFFVGISFAFCKLVFTPSLKQTYFLLYNQTDINW